MFVFSPQKPKRDSYWVLTSLLAHASGAMNPSTFHQSFAFCGGYEWTRIPSKPDSVDPSVTPPMSFPPQDMHFGEQVAFPGKERMFWLIGLREPSAASTCSNASLWWTAHCLSTSVMANSFGIWCQIYTEKHNHCWRPFQTLVGGKTQMGANVIFFVCSAGCIFIQTLPWIVLWERLCISTFCY